MLMHAKDTFLIFVGIIGGLLINYIYPFKSESISALLGAIAGALLTMGLELFKEYRLEQKEKEAFLAIVDIQPELFKMIKNGLNKNKLERRLSKELVYTEGDKIKEIYILFGDEKFKIEQNVCNHLFKVIHDCLITTGPCHHHMKESLIEKIKKWG